MSYHQNKYFIIFCMRQLTSRQIGKPYTAYRLTNTVRTIYRLIKQMIRKHCRKYQKPFMCDVVDSPSVSAENQVTNWLVSDKNRTQQFLSTDFDVEKMICATPN